MDTSLDFESKEQPDLEYGISLNFVDYTTLIRSIPQNKIASLPGTQFINLPWCQEYKNNFVWLQEW